MTWSQINCLLWDVDHACNDVPGVLNFAVVSAGCEAVVYGIVHALDCGSDLQVLLQQSGVLFP